MPTNSPEADHITVSELIAHVTGELRQAKVDAATTDGEPTLKLKEAKLTLSYEVTKTAGGGIEIAVVKGDASRERTMGNQIELTFTAGNDGMVYLTGGAEGAFGPQGPVPAPPD